MNLLSLPTAALRRHSAARPLNDAALSALADSIEELGLLNPIRVRQFGDGYEVIAGHHRFAAMDLLGRTSIDCIVVDDDDMHAELAMIDENLFRAELSPAERASQTARRKVLYETLHPETQHGSPGVSRQVGDTRERAEKDRFTADTAAATGKSERAVQRDAERGEKVIPEAMQMVSGTKLDTGAYLDKLKRLSPNEQVHVVKRDLAQARRDDEERAERGGIAGRIKQAPAEPPLPTFDEIAGMLDRLWKLSVEDFIRICPPQKRAAMCQRMSRLQTVFEKVAEEVVS